MFAQRLAKTIACQHKHADDCGPFLRNMYFSCMNNELFLLSTPIICINLNLFLRNL